MSEGINITVPGRSVCLFCVFRDPHPLLMNLNVEMLMKGTLELSALMHTYVHTLIHTYTLHAKKLHKALVHELAGI